MIKIKKISPVKLMMDHWLEIPGLKGDVGCTSLVIRLAKNLGLLQDASITYIDTPHWLIDYNYFNHAHTKKGERWQISYDVCRLHNRDPVTQPEPQFICGGFSCF